jgi:dipeptidyl aminopeptidase/acylaminoacyl peptidase
MGNPDSVTPQNPDGAISISPDGKRYVARLVRGDVKRNGVWVELLAGRLDSLDISAQHETVAQLFTTGLGTGDSNFGAVEDTNQYSTPIRWLDDDHIVFLWSNDRGIRQLVRLSLVGHQLEYLTNHPTHLVAFDISAAGAVLYNAQARRSDSVSAQMLKQGFVIDDDTDPSSLFRGDISGGTIFDRAWNTEWFVMDKSSPVPRRLAIGGREIAFDYRHRISFSPDGRLALVNAGAGQIPAEWDKYTGPDPHSWIVEARRDPRATMGRGVHRLFLVDIEHGTSRPLWEALSLLYVSGAAWSPDGRSILFAPTFLPAQSSDARGLAGRAAAIVDVATGRYEQLPIELPEMRMVAALRWLAADKVQISERDDAGITHHQFERVSGRWQTVEHGGTRETPAAPLRIEVREDLVTPPRVFAVDAVTGKERMILDANPRLTSDFALGRVERIDGTLKGGEKWEGLIFYPVHYKSGRGRSQRRYPLVIQSQYGAIGTGFTLYGADALGPTQEASYPGQVLANRDIAVLHLNVRMGPKFNTPEEAETRRIAFETVAEQLVESGLVDRHKIGLLGFSRNGYYVEYTLTHSRFAFAAAIAADNWDPSYFLQTMTGDVGDATAVIGTPPFGEGLKIWLQNAPGFNVEKIHTPLRMVEQSGGLFGVLAKWEIFSRLRYLNKPVEFYVVPDSEHGSHATQNPAQILAVQQGSVDWFDFWLNEYEDSSPQKAQQYERWRKLRQLHEADLKKSTAE